MDSSVVPDQDELLANETESPLIRSGNDDEDDDCRLSGHTPSENQLTSAKPLSAFEKMLQKMNGPQRDGENSQRRPASNDWSWRNFVNGNEMLRNKKAFELAEEALEEVEPTSLRCLLTSHVVLGDESQPLWRQRRRRK